MDSKRTEQKGELSSPLQEPSTIPEEPLKTPVRLGKGSKRKLQTPNTTPGGKTNDVEKPSSAKKRRKSTSGTPLSRVGSPSSLLKPALTERQQMALLLQMTDPQKQAPASGEEVSPRVDTTPKSRVQRRNERGEAPLHIACIKGDLKTASSLIEQGADVNATDHAGWTPLHEASNYGYANLVALLLEGGAHANPHGMDGDTPLHDATINNHLEVVQVLMEHGADPNLANDKGVTPTDTCKDNRTLRLLTGEVKKLETSGGLDEEAPLIRKRRSKRGETPPSSSSPRTGTETSDTDSSSQKAEHGTPSLSQSSSSPSLSILAKRALRPLVTKLKAGVYSDVSSSESDSEYFESAAKKKKLLSFTEKLEELSESRETEETTNEPSKMGEGKTDGEKQPQVQGTRHPQEIAVKEAIASDLSDKPAGQEKEVTSVTTGLEGATPGGSEETIEPDEPDARSMDMDSTASPEKKSTEGTNPDQPEQTLPLPLPQIVEPERPGSEAESDVDIDTASSSPRAMLQATAASSESMHSLVISVPLSLVKVHSLRGAEGGRGAARHRRDRTPVKAEQESTNVAVSKERLSGDPEPLEVGRPSGKGSVKDKLMMVEPSSERSIKVAPTMKERLSKSATSDPREAKGAPERQDSSHDSKMPTAPSKEAVTTEKHTKHSRKPQHVFSSKKLFRESKKDAQLECRETLDMGDKQEDTVSFSVSVGWGALASQPMKSTMAKQATSHKHGGRKRDEGYGNQRSRQSDSEEEKSDDHDTSKSTIISLPTSLPIVFSGHAGWSQGMQQGLHPKQQAGKDTLTTPPTFKPKTLPILLEAVKSSTPHKKGSQAGTTSVKEAPQLEHEGIPLPPKKRYRAVQRSGVVQQRQEKQGPPPPKPAHFESFLMCTGEYRSKKSLQPTNPKAVYPPIHTAMYRLFTEQESERTRLAAAHLAEQDRLLLSMEQELVRAHQRATKSHTPISACSVLLERLLPRLVCEQQLPGDGERPTDVPKQSPTTKARESSDPLNERLLAGLVQDVWDKFYQLKMSLLSRQHHEAKALWLVQRDQWVERLAELGFSKPASSHDVPGTHTPLTTSLIRELHVS